MVMYQFSVPHSIHCSSKGWENVRFELGSERVKTKTMAAAFSWFSWIMVQSISCSRMFLELHQILFLTDCSWVLVRRLFLPPGGIWAALEVDYWLVANSGSRNIWIAYTIFCDVFHPTSTYLTLLPPPPPPYPHRLPNPTSPHFATHPAHIHKGDSITKK